MGFWGASWGFAFETDAAQHLVGGGKVILKGLIWPNKLSARQQC